MRLVLEIHGFSDLSLALSGSVRRLDLPFIWDLSLVCIRDEPSILVAISGVSCAMSSVDV